MSQPLRLYRADLGWLFFMNWVRSGVKVVLVAGAPLPQIEQISYPCAFAEKMRRQGGAIRGSVDTLPKMH